VCILYNLLVKNYPAIHQATGGIVAISQRTGLLRAQPRKIEFVSAEILSFCFCLKRTEFVANCLPYELVHFLPMNFAAKFRGSALASLREGQVIHTIPLKSSRPTNKRYIMFDYLKDKSGRKARDMVEVFKENFHVAGKQPGSTLAELSEQEFMQLLKNPRELPATSVQGICYSTHNVGTVRGRIMRILGSKMDVKVGGYMCKCDKPGQLLNLYETYDFYVQDCTFENGETIIQLTFNRPKNLDMHANKLNQMFSEINMAPKDPASDTRDLLDMLTRLTK
jgi:hypothetical protein